MAVTASAWGLGGAVVTSFKGDSASGLVQFTSPPIVLSQFLVSLSFAVPSLNVPNAVFSPADADFAGLRAYAIATQGGFTIGNTLTAAATQSYAFAYETNV